MLGRRIYNVTLHANNWKEKKVNYVKFKQYELKFLIINEFYLDHDNFCLYVDTYGLIDIGIAYFDRVIRTLKCSALFNQQYNKIFNVNDS
jgi:hypothetical protein